MKKFLLFMVIAGAGWGVVTATAQGTLRASLAPAVPDPENYSIRASASFLLDGPSVSFTISLGAELSGAAAPTSARLWGAHGEFAFELGAAKVRGHFPLPWPSQPWQYDYGASTSFGGSFDLPDNLREDFLAGRTTRRLLAGELGVFMLVLVPASSLVIKGLAWQGSSIAIRFIAEPSYLYTVQYADSLVATNWSDLGKVDALSQSFETVVTDPITNAAARFYRFSRALGDLKTGGIVGQVFVGGYCPQVRPEFDCSPRPYQTTVGVLSAAGDPIGQFTTEADGRFHYWLSAGDYLLVPLNPQGGIYPFAAPVSVTVERGRLTTKILILNAGIY